MSELTTNETTFLLRLRSQYKRLEQLTWTVRELQQRFPVGTPKEEFLLLKSYVALITDLKDIADEMEALKKEYGYNK